MRLLRLSQILLAFYILATVAHFLVFEVEAYGRVIPFTIEYLAAGLVLISVLLANTFRLFAGLIFAIFGLITELYSRSAPDFQHFSIPLVFGIANFQGRIDAGLVFAPYTALAEGLSVYGLIAGVILLGICFRQKLTRNPISKSKSGTKISKTSNFCHKCGSELSGNFCRNCGAKSIQ